MNIMFTSLLLPAMILAPALSDSSIGTIQSIDRTSVFMGRLGRRTVEKWAVNTHGKTVTIEFYPYHTNVAKTKNYVVGDAIQMKSNWGVSVKTDLSSVKISKKG
jgi:hypothetical protein